MNTITQPQREALANLSHTQRRAHIGAVARVAVISIVVSELITVVLMKALVGDHLAEGMLIALVCSGPLSAWITDREIRMHHLIARQRDQLSELNLELNARNSDLDAFARAVAHDLKNPLTTIIGMAEVISADSNVAGTEERDDFIRLIVQSGDRAVDIIDGLLLLHGIQHETQELAPVDTDTTVDIALATMAGVITNNAAVVTRSKALPPVLAYGPWLTEVWTNLIGNAIKYGGSPPTVEIDARLTSNGQIRFTVQDNGSGIDPNARDQLFQEFERGGRTDVEGHGLGLAIVNRAVSRLGGETGIDSAPDGGSVFWFTIPRA